MREVFPESRDKKVILYLPSIHYRNKKSKYKEFLDLEKLKKLIGNEYIVAIHASLPKKEYSQDLNIKEFSKNLNGKLFMTQLLCTADIVVGDHRDTFFETALLHKPAFLQMDDPYSYLKNRKTLCSFSEAMIGPMIKDEENLAEKLNNIKDYDYSLQEGFRNKYLTYCDGKSAKRVVNYILRNEQKRE